MYSSNIPHRLQTPVDVKLLCIESHRKTYNSLKRNMLARKKLYNGKYKKDKFNVSVKYECNTFKVC